MLLDGKVAIVSGAGPGLGREAALAMVREGASVALGARRREVLAEIVAEVEAAGGQALAVRTDITDPAQCRRLVEATVERFGGLDVLVNNAFVPDVFKRFEDVDLGDWRRIFDVNVFGTLQLTQAAIPALRARGGGSVVIVTSMVVRKPLARQVGYAASKAALTTAAQGLARELGPHRIRVNTVVPGWMLGPSVEAMFSWNEQRKGVSRQAQYDEIAANLALGQIPSDADVAGAVVFLASDLSSMITGQAIDVNGGEVFH